MKRAASIILRQAITKRGKKECPTFNQIIIKDLSGFEEINLKPKSGFVAFCGGSGVGKTSVLRALAFSLSAFDDPDLAYFSARLGNFKVEISIEHKEGIYHRAVRRGGEDSGPREGFQPQVRLITLYERTEELLQAFEDETDQSITAPYDPKNFTKDQIALASRALGKAYRNIQVFEIDDDLSRDGILPYFIVQEDEVSYGVNSMGTGELSVIYMTWLMNYLPRQSILIIEEPEAMIPPSGQLAVFDILCSGAVKQQIALVMSTHSTEIVSQIPMSNLYPLNRLGSVTSCAVEPSRKDSILSQLGLKVGKDLIVFVEDELAMHVSRELLARFDLRLTRRVEFVNVGSGFGAIKVAVEKFPPLKSFSIIGLLDGDMKDEAAAWVKKELCCFLPFDTNMEGEFLEAVAFDVEGFARAIGRSVSDVRNGLRRAQGQEEHDGFHDFRQEVSLSSQQISNHCINQWLARKNRNHVCDTFFKSFQKLSLK